MLQTFHMIAGLSAIDNASLKLVGTGLRVREAHQRMTPLLTRLGLDERADHRVGTLSMGERQRVAIAKALSTDPGLLLADEPTGNLDTRRGYEVLALLRELCRERDTAVLLVTHDPQAAALADRVLALRDGRLVEYLPDVAARLTDPAAAVSLRNLVWFYRRRVRARAVQELLALVGIAVGVALLFAVQVSNRSLSASIAQLTHGLVGNAQLQLVARGPQGFDERLLNAGWKASTACAPPPRCCRCRSTSWGRDGSRSATLLAADPRLAHLGGRSAERLCGRTPRAACAPPCCPLRWRRALGVRFGESVTLQVHGTTVRRPVGAIVSRGDVGVARRRAAVVIAARRTRSSSTGMERSRLAHRGAGGPKPASSGRSRRCAGRRGAHRRAGRRRSDARAVRPGRHAERSVDRVVRAHQRARRLPARVQRDAADGAGAAPR